MLTRHGLIRVTVGRVHTLLYAACKHRIRNHVQDFNEGPRLTTTTVIGMQCNMYTVLGSLCELCLWLCAQHNLYDLYRPIRCIYARYTLIETFGFA